MPTWASTLLGVAVGSGLTYLVSVRVEAARRRRDEQRDRRLALATYLGRLTIVVSFVRDWPEGLTPSPLERVRKATWERSARVRTNDWIRSQQHLREILGPDPYRPLHRLIEAYSTLRFARLDETVWNEVVRSMNYVERLAHDRSQPALDAWSEIRSGLFSAIRESGDEVAIEASEPAEELAEPAPTSDLAAPSA